jgi:hypothetical protein
MDYETLSQCFLGVFEHYKDDKDVKVFTIGLLRNDLEKILEFFDENIKHNQWHISFNGLAFDAQVTEFIIRNRKRLLKLSGVEAARLIYAKAQDAINKGRNKEFQEWSENKLSIKQIDVFKLNHWDNTAKRSSLKWIQGSMDWYNVQDMPIEHTAEITTVEELQEIASYCRNDVSSTKKIMELSKKQIELRGELTQKYGINLYSASEPRISKEIFLYFLEKELSMRKYDLKQMRTYRKEIVVKDLILPYIKFETKEFKELYDNFSSLVLDPDELKGQFKASVNYRGVRTDFGLGGVHGAKRGIYIPEEHQMIMSSDVTSFYPNLAIRNKWSPGHLPAKAFCRLYEWFFDERRLIPKSNILNYVYKIILNSTYGLSNDKTSFLYDPELTMRITINGQLSLMMLYERLAENIPGAIPIMQNTDGVEFMIPKKYKEKYLEICKEWEELTSLELEHDEYQKMIVPDVNNYIAVYSNKEVSKEDYHKYKLSSPENIFKEENGKYYMGKSKRKGRFEFIDLPLHKNKSYLAVRKALYYFFVHGIDPEITLKENRNILDYCSYVKIKGAWKFTSTHVENGDVIEEDLQKTLRYYVSSKGVKLLKKNLETPKVISVNSGRWLQTIFNKHDILEWDAYGVDEKFYMDKVNNEIAAMQPELFINQINLFNN